MKKMYWLSMMFLLSGAALFGVDFMVGVVMILPGAMLRKRLNEKLNVDLGWLGVRWYHSL